jgi:hypothetical protein
VWRRFVGGRDPLGDMDSKALVMCLDRRLSLTRPRGFAARGLALSCSNARRMMRSCCIRARCRVESDVGTWVRPHPPSRPPPPPPPPDQPRDGVASAHSMESVRRFSCDTLVSEQIREMVSRNVPYAQRADTLRRFKARVSLTGCLMFSVEHASQLCSEETSWADLLSRALVVSSTSVGLCGYASGAYGKHSFLCIRGRAEGIFLRPARLFSRFLCSLYRINLAVCRACAIHLLKLAMEAGRGAVCVICDDGSAEIGTMRGTRLSLNGQSTLIEFNLHARRCDARVYGS